MDILLTLEFRKIIKEHRIELRQPPLDLKKIDNSWTLFLDRDGVINHEKKDELYF